MRERRLAAPALQPPLGLRGVASSPSLAPRCAGLSHCGRTVVGGQALMEHSARYQAAESREIGGMRFTSTRSEQSKGDGRADTDRCKRARWTRRLLRQWPRPMGDGPRRRVRHESPSRLNTTYFGLLRADA